MSPTPIIAIVGRPNVGKSRLFNRLSSTTQAIVHDFEGVTRDRQYAPGEWYDRHFITIDTGGFVPSAEDELLSQMRAQATLAIEEADIIIFMMDGRSGLVDGDEEINTMLRHTEKPVFHVINKIDAPTRRDEMLADFYVLGHDLFPLSAEHGLGLDHLMDSVAELLAPPVVEEEPPSFARIAVVGKPNAGKSSLINKLLGEDRLLTSDIAGTTRDSIDTMVEHDGREYMLIDTAGLRRKKSISSQLEQFAVIQAIKSLDRADVALLVIDATVGLTSQDKKIAGVISNRGRACVILLNKWDQIDQEVQDADEWRRHIREEMPFIAWAPIMLVSALTGKRVHRVLDKVDEVFERYTTRVGTSELNRFLEMALAMHSPPVAKNRRLKFYYMSQVAIRPPAFVYMCNHPESVPPSYKRFLENRLREQYDFMGTPVRTMMRSRRRNEYF